MQPSFVSFIGLLSIVDAAAITTRLGFAALVAPSPSSTSTTSSILPTLPASTVLAAPAVASSSIAAVVGDPQADARVGFAAITTAAARVGFGALPVAVTTTSKRTTTSLATTSSKPSTSSKVTTTMTSAKSTTSTTSVKPTTSAKPTTSTKPSTSSTSTKSTTSTTSSRSTTSTTLVKTTTTSKTSSTAAAATATALGTTSTKRGLCWPWNNAASTFSLFSPSHETWLYNWEMWSPTSGTSFSSAEYVGMVRVPARLSEISWYYTSTSQVSKYILGFNEPDLTTGDTYVSVADAVTYWKEYFLPLRKNYGTILGAPAVTNAVATNWGIDWLNQFNAACTDTTTTPGKTLSCFDFIPIHWYGYYLADFQNYVLNFHSVYPSYQLWITEFAFTDHPASEVQVLAKAAIEWLDTQSYVSRYSMFGPMNAANMAGITGAAMVSDDLSSLTNVGKVYHGTL